MILYQIQDRLSDLWYRHGPNGGTWVIDPQNASIWVNKNGLPSALNSIDRTRAKVLMRDPIVREFDPFAALGILRDLFEVRSLGDYVYDIRERECENWDGPLVTKWGDACARAQKLLEVSQ